MMIQLQQKSPFFSIQSTTQFAVGVVLWNYPPLAIGSAVLAMIISWDLQRTKSMEAVQDLKQSPYFAIYEVMKMEMRVPLYWIDETMAADKINSAENLVALTIPSILRKIEGVKLEKEPARLLYDDENSAVQSFGKEVAIKNENGRLKKQVDIKVSASKIQQLNDTGFEGLIKKVALYIHEVATTIYFIAFFSLLNFKRADNPPPKRAAHYLAFQPMAMKRN